MAIHVANYLSSGGNHLSVIIAGMGKNQSYDVDIIKVPINPIANYFFAKYLIQAPIAFTNELR